MTNLNESQKPKKLSMDLKWKHSHIISSDAEDDDSQPPTISVINEHRSLPVTNYEKDLQLSNIDNIPYIDDGPSNGDQTTPEITMTASLNQASEQRNNNYEVDGEPGYVIRATKSNNLDCKNAVDKNYEVEGEAGYDIKLTQSDTQRPRSNCQRSKTDPSDKLKSIDTKRNDFLTSSMDSNRIKPKQMRNPRAYGR